MKIAGVGRPAASGGTRAARIAVGLNDLMA
jgi:hypothetical protein